MVVVEMVLDGLLGESVPDGWEIESLVSRG